MKILTLPLLIGAVVIEPSGQEQPRVEHPEYPPVTIVDTQVRTISSKAVDDEYLLQVALPSGYPDSQEPLPALYLLDANEDFGMLVGIARRLQSAKEIAPFLIVGIAYDEYPRYYRQRDYTPTHMADIENSGGASAFLQFMTQELIPFVERTFNVDSKDRALVGHSLGGLFAVYALFRSPGTFRRIVASSPSVGWDNQVVLEHEEAYHETTTTQAASLFFSIGDLETEYMRSSFEALAARLEQRRYTDLAIYRAVLAGETHGSVKAAAYTKGLKAIFAP